MDAVAASRKEQALWLLESFVPDSGVNNLSTAFRVAGDLAPQLLQDVVDRLVARHEVLRTVFREQDGTLLRQVLTTGAVRVAVEPLAPAGGTAEDDLTPYIARPFRTDGSPLLRAAHLRHPDGDVFCVAVHHSVFDGASSMILLREAATLYELLAGGHDVPAELAAPVPAWTPPPPSEASERFWREQLDGFRPTDLALRCEKPGGSQTTLLGGVVNHELSAQALAVVRRLQRALRAPEAVVLLAAYYVLLAAHGAGPDLTVGSPVSLRGQGEQDRIGYHINVLTLRARVTPEESFRQLVSATRKVFLGAMAHADYPVDDLLEIVPRDDAAWRNILFRHVFNYAPMAGATEFTLTGLPARQIVAENGSSKFDLEFFVSSAADRLQVRAAYYADVFEHADVEALVQRYEALLLTLDTAHDRPIGELRVWSPRDTAVIGAANATERPVPYGSVLKAVAAVAAARPAATALRDGDRDVSYAALWTGALRVRDDLRAAGIGRGDVVALAAPRGPELAAGALGVWLAGAAYLPLEPSHPASRLAYQLQDSGARAVLRGAGTALDCGQTPALTLPALPDAADTAPQTDAATPSSGECAYLIYTSGSTGRPKGTLVGHGALANLVAHFADELSAKDTDSALWLTTFSFDISALELFLPLTVGGAVVVAPDEARTDGTALADVLVRHDVGIVQATPTTWRMVLDQAGDRLGGRRVLSGGEPLPLALAQRLAATGCRLHNVYGPTETTIWSTSGAVPEDVARVDVGGPLANTRLFVEGRPGQELPVGVSGELCIAGAGVALGYHGRPELTAERFGDHPEHGRYYRTGDLARWLPGGRMEILGRADRQIKLRGNRIELGEIEAVLLEHPQVRGAAVVVAGDPGSDAVLTAFVVVGDPAATGTLWEHARGTLPPAAVPQSYVAVESFPMTGNNKVDIPALTRLAEQHRAEAESGTDTANSPATAPGDDPVVDFLVGQWEKLLRRTDLGPDANFFASGGHSLLGAVLVQRAEAEFGVRLKLTELFDHPTPVALAARVRALPPREDGAAGA
ncbi:non-ribosomal peptide synthetase [Actinacidiphila epipremni]|uniref:Amino acid adenylation domain-containing protein n=1 Tax=Actinacidiphila epipremni TaxID=2053013 RepID=A0ABX0ZPY4_9ACTN|nr:non-ribosomal peptide synthetase [Actinacidiphila epipremni]NJP44349.1 amino acid adenylation domain-containing protein [Actinacidiphila epipremni]